ncbi:MAG: permease, partial [Microcystaceae cyanobacterium]
LASRSTLLKSGTFLLPQTDSQLIHRVGKLSYEYQTTTANNIPFKSQFSLWLENTVREFLELGSILIIGCASAAIIQVVLPPTVILAWGQTLATKILVMLLLGTVLSLGSIADISFVSYFSSTFLNGALLAFVLSSSILDLRSIVLILSTFHFKIVIYLLILAGELSFLLSLLLDYYVS